MSISDRTRKSLWAKSGNRCIICRNELVQPSESSDGNVILGEECHIISEKVRGPRGEIYFDKDFDHYDNLILLCAKDHKIIDEPNRVYSVEKLRRLKADHENWVKVTLENDVLAFTNDRYNIKSLPKITSGKQVIDLIDGSKLFEFEQIEIENAEEISYIGGLFEELKDYGDIFSDIGFSERASLQIQYSKEIEKLKKMGISLFGLRRQVKLHNSFQENLGYHYIASLIAVRQDSSSIVANFLIAKFPTKVALT
jgi:hypothetical protein